MPPPLCAGAPAALRSSQARAFHALTCQAYALHAHSDQAYTFNTPQPPAASQKWGQQVTTFRRAGCGGCEGPSATCQRSWICTASTAGPASPAHKRDGKYMAVHGSTWQLGTAWITCGAPCCQQCGRSSACTHTLVLLCPPRCCGTHLLQHLQLLCIVRLPGSLGPPAQTTITPAPSAIQILTACSGEPAAAAPFAVQTGAVATAALTSLGGDLLQGYPGRAPPELHPPSAPPPLPPPCTNSRGSGGSERQSAEAAGKEAQLLASTGPSLQSAGPCFLCPLPPAPSPLPPAPAQPQPQAQPQPAPVFVLHCQGRGVLLLIHRPLPLQRPLRRLLLQLSKLPLALRRQLVRRQLQQQQRQAAGGRQRVGGHRERIGGYMEAPQARRVGTLPGCCRACHCD